MQRIEYRGKRDILVQSLRAAILRGELKVGTPLRQDEIAARFGVSATPVREALRVLEAQGLVTYELHRGVTVADFIGSYEQLYRLRAALEGLAAELAAERATDELTERLIELAYRLKTFSDAGAVDELRETHAEFHRVLYRGSEFPALVGMIEQVWSRQPWDELLSLPGLHTADDHLRIAQLAGAHDVEGTSAFLHGHLRSVRLAMIAEQRRRGTPPEGVPA